MLEVRAIGDALKYAYGNDTSPNEKNQGAEFTELMENSEYEFTESPELSVVQTATHDDLIVSSDREVVTYTFLGKKALFNKFSGRNVDIAI
ncbi:hypothetical protein ACFL1R_10285 [Candidatus Latescibacterota bacterium]